MAVGHAPRSVPTCRLFETADIYKSLKNKQRKDGQIIDLSGVNQRGWREKMPEMDIGQKRKKL